MDGADQPKTRKRNIIVCTPIQRLVEADFCGSLIRTINETPAKVGWTSVTGHANVPRARNVLTERALQYNPDDIVMIDADLGWEPDAFDALFKDVPDDVGVIAGVPQKRDEKELGFCGAIDPGGARIHPDAPRLVSGYAATAFMRIRRQVFERLKDKVETFNYRGVDCRAYFHYKIGKNAVSDTIGYIGEDFFFSMLCKENDIDVWLDPTIKLRHWHSSPLTDSMADHLHRFDPPEEKEPAPDKTLLEEA